MDDDDEGLTGANASRKSWRGLLVRRVLRLKVGGACSAIAAREVRRMFRRRYFVTGVVEREGVDDMADVVVAAAGLEEGYVDLLRKEMGFNVLHLFVEG